MKSKKFQPNISSIGEGTALVDADLDAEAAIPVAETENNAPNTVSTSTRSVRFGTGAYRRNHNGNGRRRESWFSRQRSTLRRRYSVDPNEGRMGEMIGDMANAMADNEDLANRNAELSLKLSKMGIKLLVLVCLLALMAIATGVTSYFAITESETNLQNSITDSVVTGVQVDSTGTAHLTDKNGRDMSTRATGDLYSAELIRAPSGRQLHCVTVEDAANMAHSIASGADAHVALMDESGVLEQEILSLSGNFEDAGDALDFASGNIHVLLDDDSCNVDEDGENDNDNESKNNTDLFTRGLDEKDSTSTPKRSDILARNREIYYKHRSALKTGQRALKKKKGNKVPITSDKDKEKNAVLIPEDISDFAEILFTETQQSLVSTSSVHDNNNYSSGIIIRSMELFEESHGKMETEVKNQLMTVLADDSNDQFDNSKILMIEKQEGKNVCELGSANLCKGEKKSNMEQEVREAVLQGIQEASEDLDNEPDIEVILLGVQEKLGVDASTIEWFIHENQTTMQDISDKFKVAKEKYIEKVLTNRSEKVEQVLNDALDAGSSIESAVSESEFSDDEIEDAFLFFPQEKKDEIRGKAGKSKNEQQQKVDKAYENLGFKKNGKSKWEAPSAQEEPFVIGEDGKMYYSKSKGKKQAQEQINEAKQKVNDEHQGRRLKVQEHKKNISSFKANVPRRIAVIQHRLMLEMEDLAADACPRINIGCFGDSQDDRALQLNLGSGYSISSCLDQCHNEGYPYAGLQAGSTCFCGDDTYGKYGESDTCSIACTTGVGVCGGLSANSIYKYIGLPNAECVSEKFQALSSDLANVTSHVVEMVYPITQILDSMEWAVGQIEMASSLSAGIVVAVELGSNIPYIGEIIQVAQRFIGPVDDAIQAANDRVQDYQETVGTLWKNSFGRILDLFQSFDTRFVTPIAGAAAGVSALGNNQCAKSVFTNIAGDLITPIETAFGTVMSFVESLLDSLQSLLDVLASTAWQMIQNGLKAVLEKVTPVLDWLNPLEGLGALLDAEVTLPWFQLPYLETKLGDAYCDSGYYKGSWPSTCWENESNEWEEKWSVSPYQMKKKCSYVDYQEDALTGACWNDNYLADRKAQTWGWINNGYVWGPWCPDWNYDTMNFAPTQCIQQCPSDRFMAGMGYCYKNTCHSGYDLDGRHCWGNTKDQLYHEARCDNYSYEEGTSRYLDDGECWQGCNENHGSFFGACFPPAELTLSINMLVDAFQDIIDFITGLPIVSTIKEAINTIVGAVLQPVMDYINSMTSFNFPAFPSFNIDLPLDVSFDLPQLPDISQHLTNLPETIFSSLPLPSSIADCGLDMNCISEATGMDEIFTIVESLGEIFQVLNIENLKSNIANALSSATCAEWEDITLPVNDLLSKVPALAGTTGCDVVIPMCKNLDFQNLDFSNSFTVLADIREAFESLFGIGRRLNSASTEMGTFAVEIFSNTISEMISFDMKASMLVQWGASSNVVNKFGGLSGSFKFVKKIDGSTKKKAMWLSTTFDPKLKVSPSIDLVKGKLSIVVTAEFGVDTAWNSGVKRLLNETLDKIEDYEKENMAADLINETCADLRVGEDPIWKEQNTELGKRICSLKVKAISQANQEWYMPLNSLPDWMGDYVKASDLNNPIPEACVESELKEMVGSSSDLSTGEEFDDAYECIQYWHDLHYKVNKLKKHIEFLEIGMVGNLFYDNFVDYSTLAFKGLSLLQQFANSVSTSSSTSSSSAVSFESAVPSDKPSSSLAPSGMPSSSPWLNSVSYQLGLTMCHPTYRTCLGPIATIKSTGSLEWESYDIGEIDTTQILEDVKAVGSAVGSAIFSGSLGSLTGSFGNLTLTPSRMRDWPKHFKFKVQYKRTFPVFDGDWTWSE